MIQIKDTKRLDSFFEKDACYDRKRMNTREIKLFGLTIWKTIEDLTMNIDGRTEKSCGFKQ